MAGTYIDGMPTGQLSGYTQAAPGPKATGQTYWDGNTQYDAYGNMMSHINAPAAGSGASNPYPTPWAPPPAPTGWNDSWNPTVGSASSSVARPPAGTPTQSVAILNPGGGVPATGGVVGSYNPGTAGMPPPPTTTGASIGPQLQQVQANQTVQGQLADILKTGNPLLEGAKTRAAQAANARGLQNSSMAVQSGEEAIVNTAMPIAQQDAAVYQKQALVNQDISNQFLSIDKGAAYDLEKAYAAFQQNNYLFDKDAALKKYISDTGNSTQEKVAAMQVAASQANTAAQIQGELTRTGMTIDAQKSMQLAGFQNSDYQQMKGFQNQNFQTYSNGVLNIQLSSNDPESKQAGLRTWNSIYAGVPTGITIDTSAAFPPPNTVAPGTVTESPSANNTGDHGGG
jgi:hypothetical protein